MNSPRARRARHVDEPWATRTRESVESRASFLAACVRERSGLLPADDLLDILHRDDGLVKDSEDDDDPRSEMATPMNVTRPKSKPASRAILAKLSPPRLPAVVNRQRLFRELDAGRKRPLVWISGPPGAGKTTLIASYLRARKPRCLWYQIDERDRDPGSFFHYLHLAGGTVAGRGRRPLPRFGPEHQASLTGFARNFFEELYRSTKPPFLLVFDDYQEVDSESSLHELLATGSSLIPEGVNVIISSRELPPPAFSPLQARRSLSRIPPEAFRLTVPEARAIARLHRPSRSRSGWSQELMDAHRQLRGWAAGFILFLEHPVDERGDVSPATEGALEPVFDYFVHDVLEKLPREAQRFLSMTSVLPDMTVSLAEKLTGYDSTGELLSWLYRNRLFVERRGGDEQEHVYQYHPLFRSSLLRRAEVELDRVERQDFRSRAATCLERVGRLQEAFELLRESPDIEHKVRLILEDGPVLMSQGRFQMLAEWIESIPEERVSQDPWLMYWLATSRLFNAPAESERLYERAYERFSQQGEAQGKLLAWCGVVDSILLAWKDFSRIRPWLDRFPDLLEGNYAHLPPEIESHVVFSVFTGLMWGNPEHPRTRYWVERALDQVRSVEDLTLAAWTAHYLTVYSVWVGDTYLGDKVVTALRHRLEGSDPPTLAKLHTLMSEGIHFWVTGEPESSVRSLREGLDEARRHGIAVLESPFRQTLVYPYIYSGDWQGASDALRSHAPEMTDREDLMGSAYHFQAGWVAAAQGNARLALDHVNRVLRSLDRALGPFVKALHQTCRAIALSDLGNRSEATSVFREVEGFAHRTGSESLLFTCYLSRAHLELNQGDEGEGVRLLKQAVSIGREKNYVDGHWWQPDKLAFLCCKALDEGIEVDYLRSLIRRRRLKPPPHATESWPWAMKVRVLGAFELEVNGEPLTFARKAQRRPLALLKAIIALGSNRVSFSALADKLWPDADGDQAHQALTVTIHRLRKLLGSRDALRVSEGAVSLCRDRCWVDAWSFEWASLSALTASDEKTLCKFADAALKLYRGPFLPDEMHEPWTAPLRERLRGRLCRLAARARKYEDLDLSESAHSRHRNTVE